MNRQETLKILAVLKAAYPQFYAKQSKDELNEVLALWQSMFEDEPYELVATALKALIKTRANSYPPSIGELNEKIQQLTTTNDMSEAEAWNKIYEAICSALYWSEENFAALPPPLQKIVGSPRQLRDWAMMEPDTVNSVIASNVQRSYKTVMKREREMKALPSSVKGFIEKLSENFSYERLEHKETKDD